ncbi:TIM-barrel domain-containing protein [Rhodospirillum sp. A1_3_36]|uniref:glycoside hydrolase family 31 protein n=1 Tax=Rhodospirillum sp. A1_3_36 TaxID=3391666 RepID=UPI0039A56C9E
MKTLKTWTLARVLDNGLEFRVEDRHLFTILVLEDALIRVHLRKDGAFRLDRTWSIAPDGDVPWSGRPRESLDGFALPSFSLEQEADRITLTTQTLRVTITQPLALSWEARGADGLFRPIAQDRPTGAYMLGVRDHAHAHFLLRHPGERVYGLGEKAGPLERTGQRYEMRDLDAMGYDARTTDPLYKHIPFTLTRTEGAGTVGLFHDNLATCWYDLGNELDNYHKPFRAYRAEDGDLDYYLSWAPSLLEVVKTQERLTGGTAFPPLWSLGYSGSTMLYTDAPDAQARLEGFLRLIDEHDIPCDSFQMSSGYTSIGAKRYVFNWNHDKVPDPKGMAHTFAEAGVHLAANIKPCLLQDHPRYDEAAKAGLFVREAETGAPERSAFWDDEGSHLDFTNPDTVAWWRANVTEKLLDLGIGSTWNDNNEYEIWDSTALCQGFGKPVEIGLIRPLMPVLMTRASHEAQVTHAPNKRPYLISRSGSPGLQRYAQTWSGDNRTSWETLRYNIRMGLGMSLSGLFNVGHDVGGFAGPRPEPELFVRWVQNGIFHPRFTIHSWNDDGTVNEPWMFPEVTPLIRDAIHLRYRFIPYLYSVLHRCVTEREPMLRPTFLDHEADPRCFEETDDFLIGRDLLVANVVEPGAVTRSVTLPQNDTGWWDIGEGRWHPGGEGLSLTVDLSSIPLFARGGAVLPLAEGLTRADASKDTNRIWAVFPPPPGQVGESREYSDDGLSANALAENHRLTRFTLRGETETISLSWTAEGSHRPAHDRITILLPQSETRRLAVNGSDVRSGESIALFP